MFVDPITSQTFENANQIPCEDNPQNVISLGPDTNEHTLPCLNEDGFCKPTILTPFIIV